MARYVQVLNGLVVNVWDSPPKVAIGEDGWMNAVENFPTLSSNQEYGDFTYNIGSDLVTISRDIKEIPFEVRKQSVLDNNKSQFLNFIEMSTKNAIIYSKDEIEENKQITKTNETNINACQTHNDLDNLNLIAIKLF